MKKILFIFLLMLFATPAYASNDFRLNEWQLVGTTLQPASSDWDVSITGDLTVGGSLTATYLTISQNVSSPLNIADGSDNATTTISVAATGVTTFSSTSTNPIMVFDNSGNVGIGNTAPENELEVSDSADGSQIEISTWSTTATHKSNLVLQKSSSATINTLQLTVDGEDLGSISASGVNTSSAAVAATQILFEQDDTAGATYIPGRIVFQTATNAAAIAESFRVDDSQNVLIADNNGLVVGAQAQQSIGEITAELQVLGTANPDSAIVLGQWSNTTNTPTVRFYKSRNGAVGGTTAVTTGDGLGSIRAYGDDGSDDDTLSSMIGFNTEGTISTGILPGVIKFATSNSSGTITQALEIDSEQNLTMSTSTTIAFTNNAEDSTVNFLSKGTDDTFNLLGSLNTSGFSTAEDPGQITWFNMPISSTPAAGTIQSATYKMDNENLFTLYSESSGDGGSQNRRIGIATTTPESIFVIDGGSTIATTTIEVYGIYCTEFFASDGATRLRKYYNSDASEIIEAGRCSE